MNDIVSIRNTRGFAPFERTGWGPDLVGEASTVATADDLGRLEGKEKF